MYKVLYPKCGLHGIRERFSTTKCFKALKTTKDTSKYISMYVQSWQGSLIYSKCGISLYFKKNTLA